MKSCLSVFNLGGHWLEAKQLVDGVFLFHPSLDSSLLAAILRGDPTLAFLWKIHADPSSVLATSSPTSSDALVPSSFLLIHVVSQENHRTLNWFKASYHVDSCGLTYRSENE